MESGVEQARQLLQTHRIIQGKNDSPSSSSALSRVRSPFSNFSSRDEGFSYREVNSVLATVLEADGPVEVVKGLLALGADVNFSRQRRSGTWSKLTLRQHHGQRANFLLQATVHCRPDTVRLIAAHADQENLDSVLHHAIIRGNVDVLQALLDYGANPVLLHEDFQNAIFQNQDTIVHALLSGHRLPCLSCRSAGLRLAVKNNSLHITTLLLQRWADVNYEDAIALVKAVELSRTDLVAALVSGPVRPSPRSLDAALGKAYDIMGGKDTAVGREIIGMCLSHGASGSNTTRVITEGLVDAVGKGHMKLLDLLLRHRRLPDEYEAVALLESIRTEQVDILRQLLDFAPSSSSLTIAVVKAMELNDTNLQYDVVRELVGAGARGDCAAEALVWAVRQITREVQVGEEGRKTKPLFRLLLMEGEANVDYRNGEALQLAVKSCQLDLVEEIVSREPSAESLGAALPWAMGVNGDDEKRTLIRTLLRKQICERAVGGVLVDAFRLGPRNPDLVEMLLAKTSVNFNNGEVFIYAIRNFEPETFTLLIRQSISYKALFTAVMEALKTDRPTRESIFNKIIARLGVDHLNAALKHVVLEESTDLRLAERLLRAGAEALYQEGVCIKHAVSMLSLNLARLLAEYTGSDKTVFSQALIGLLGRSIPWIALENVEIVRLLLRHGASGHAVDKALVEVVETVACSEPLRELGSILLNMLFEAKANVNCDHGKAVGIAAGRGDADLVSYLLKHGATPATMCLALSTALMAHHDEKLLLQILGVFSKHRIPSEDIGRFLPGTLHPILLCLKFYPKSVALIDSLVSVGCDFRTTIPFQVYSDDSAAGHDGPRGGEKPERISILMCSLMQEYSATSPAVYRALIHHGADVSYTTPRTRTNALMLAAMAGRYETAQLLLKSGANASSRDIFGRSSLFFAARTGDADMVALLLKSKPNTNDGSLHEASLRFHSRAMRLLIHAGHDPNHRSSMHGGRTPLGEMALHGVPPADTTGVEESLRILMDAGASPLLKVRGKTTIFLALDSTENENMVRVMLDGLLGATLHSEENTFHDGVYNFSPTMYVTKGLLMGPRTAALAQMLRNYGAEDRFYADLGETQPPDAVGLPEEIVEYERARRARDELIASYPQQGSTPRGSHASSRKMLEDERIYEQDRIVAEREMRDGYMYRAKMESEAKMKVLTSHTGHVIGKVDLEELKRWRQREDCLKQGQLRTSHG